MLGKSSKHFRQTVQEINDIVQYMKPANTTNQINENYVDSYVMLQQKKRDEQITRLLTEYVDEYANKNKSRKFFKNILFYGSIGTIVVFSGCFIYWINKAMGKSSEVSVESLVQIISVCVTFLTLIISIIKTITKYVFPQNEEEYITRIVEIIQKNDLKNKRENIRAGNKSEPANEVDTGDEETTMPEITHM